MRILQLNLNHCKTAQELLEQTMQEHKIDIALISEQYKNIDGYSWTSDGSNKSAIWTMGRIKPQSKMLTAKHGFTWVKTKGIYFFSCYAPPSLTAEEYERMLTALAFEARGKHPVLIAGDFNAWSTTWGSTRTNRRGRVLLESLALFDLELLNVPGKCTYQTERGCSIVDLAFAHSAIARNAKWTVSSIYTYSDHKAITINIPMGVEKSDFRFQRAQQKGWKRQSFDPEVFNMSWNAYLTLDSVEEVKAEGMTAVISNCLSKACDATMPRLSGRPHRKPVYWWNSHIAKLRGDCNRVRRKLKRARGTPAVDTLLAQHKTCKAALKKAIQSSKNRCFKELCDSVNVDPWGMGYKIVMRTIKNPRAPQPTCPALLRVVVSTLFPYQVEANPRQTQRVMAVDIPEVTTQEVLSTVQRIADNKAPGLDGFPNVAVKAAIKSTPEVFAKLYNTCLNEGVFPKVWKKQRLVLLLKPGKPADHPSSYRPLCMLDTLGKVLERIICNRMQEFLEKPTGFSPNQYGFRKGRSTVDAIQAVMSIARQATSGRKWKGGTKKYCAVVTLDIKNAFNSASWPQILSALRGFAVPIYLQNIISSYFENRLLLYDTDNGIGTYKVTGGVPQGSVLGPTLWNAMYDGILKLELPEDATLIGYADDIALVVVGKHLDVLQALCNDAIVRIRRWLKDMKLELAAQKTEVVLLTTRRVCEELVITVADHDIRSQPYIKYLGVLIDSKMTFKHHLQSVSEKAVRINNALTRLMRNIGSPRASIRKLLLTVTSSVILYAAPIWANTKPSYLQQVRATYRLGALRVASAYRTVSDDAIHVITGMVPIDLLAVEMYRLHNTIGQKPSNVAKKEERLRTIEEWQIRWEQSEKGRWTFELIPNIARWIEKKHGEINFCITQLLTGHGCFKAYLHKFHLENDPYCPQCPEEQETARHILFQCPRFINERNMLEGAFGENISETNLIPHMCENEENWKITCEVAANIMKNLQYAEYARRSLERAP